MDVSELSLFIFTGVLLVGAIVFIIWVHIGFRNTVSLGGGVRPKTNPKPNPPKGKVC